MEKNLQTNVLEFLIITSGANGKSYKSDYRAILNWVVEKVKRSRIQDKRRKKRIQSKYFNGGRTY